MNLDQLKIFVEVIDCGSINKAAERLYQSQPSLSRAIHALEEDIGKPLIVRNNRGITPTASGDSFYHYAQSILMQFQMLERLREMDESDLYTKLTVSVDNIFLKDNLIMEFYQHVNSQDTEIHILETTAEEVLNNVNDRKSEIGITILNDIQLPAFQRMCERKNLGMEILGSGPVYIHAKMTDALKNREEVHASEVEGRTYLHLPYDFFSNMNLSIQVDGMSPLNAERSITMSNYHAIINMLNHTPSYIFGHKWQIDELNYSNIKSFRLKNCDIQKHFIILRRQREILSKAGEVFYRIIKDSYFDI